MAAGKTWKSTLVSGQDLWVGAGVTNIVNSSTKLAPLKLILCSVHLVSKGDSKTLCKHSPITPLELQSWAFFQNDWNSSHSTARGVNHNQRSWKDFYTAKLIRLTPWWTLHATSLVPIYNSAIHLCVKSLYIVILSMGLCLNCCHESAAVG